MATDQLPMTGIQAPIRIGLDHETGCLSGMCIGRVCYITPLSVHTVIMLTITVCFVPVLETTWA